MKRTGFTILLLLNLMVISVALAQAEVYARVIVYSLIAYDGYSTEGQVIGSYDEGTQLRILGREDEAGNGGVWVYVAPSQGGVTGWVLSAYLDFGTLFDIGTLPIMGNTTPRPVLNAVLNGTTRAEIDLRNGPGAAFEILNRLPAYTPLTIIGRNRSATWLRVVTEANAGWVTYTFISLEGGLETLPIVESQETNSGDVVANSASLPVNFAGVVPEIRATVRQIYLRGQELGNNPAIFSKVGDSITASDLFLTQVNGGSPLYDYGYLQPVIDYFSQSTPGRYTSFSYPSLAARTGWQSADLLNPARAAAGFCQPGEPPLVCEYRTSRPSIALIMIGTNDLAQIDGRVYRANLENIVQISIQMGVIPVLSTLPDRLNHPSSARVWEFNEIIADVALTYDVPLWNYWLSMQRLPNLGISVDDIHPSYADDLATAIFSSDRLSYGYTMRNLTALMVLDAVWRGAMY
ncbi:MAG: SH3 domain-containing protein [Chitinophagaceae bacterium]|nr:SH3 domain-containing protein [Anaerolineae bacterium]